MGVFDIGSGDVEVTFDHVERIVAKQALEGENIASVAQEFNGESVAEPVRMGFWNTCPFPQVGEQRANGVLVHGVTLAAQEERLGRMGTFTFIEIKVQLIGSAL